MKVVLISTIVFFMFTILSSNIFAEYYLVYSASEPLPECSPCSQSFYKSSKVKSHRASHQHGRYRMVVYYVYDPYLIQSCNALPPCCYEKMHSRHKKSYDYVNFSHEATSYYRTTAYPPEYDNS